MDNHSLGSVRIMRPYVLGLITIWLIYAVLTVLAPSSTATSRYGINLTELNLIRATFLVPYLFIWLSALLAFVRFHIYARQVSTSPEGAGFNNLAKGLGLLVLTLVMPAFLGLITTYLPGSLEAQKVTAIIRNYVTVVLYLWAFWSILQASKNLNITAASEPRRIRPVVIGVMVALVFLYVWAVFSNEFRTVSNDPLVRATYFLPDWLIILTVMVPYVLIWLWGTLAIANVRHFARHVPGIVYRNSFLSVARGLTGVIVLMISLQFLSQGASLFGHARLSTILGVVYLVILLMAVPYLFLARGGRQLSAIEEV